MNLATPITGTGELVKTGDYTLYLRNAGTAGASTYSGGTVVGGGQLYVENAGRWARATCRSRSRAPGSR